MEKLWRPQGVNPYYLKGGRKPPGLLLSVLQNSGATPTESKCSKSGLLTTGHKLQHPIPKISELWEHIAAPSGAIRAQDSTEQIKHIWRQLLPFCWSDLKTRRASLERVDQGACQRKYNFFFLIEIWNFRSWSFHWETWKSTLAQKGLGLWTQSPRSTASTPTISITLKNRDSQALPGPIDTLKKITKAPFERSTVLTGAESYYRHQQPGNMNAERPICSCSWHFWMLFTFLNVLDKTQLQRTRSDFTRSVQITQTVSIS